MSDKLKVETATSTEEVLEKFVNAYEEKKKEKPLTHGLLLLLMKEGNPDDNVKVELLSTQKEEIEQIRRYEPQLAKAELSKDEQEEILFTLLAQIREKPDSANSGCRLTLKNGHEISGGVGALVMFMVLRLLQQRSYAQHKECPEVMITQLSLNEDGQSGKVDFGGLEDFSQPSLPPTIN